MDIKSLIMDIKKRKEKNYRDMLKLIIHKMIKDKIKINTFIPNFLETMNDNYPSRYRKTLNKTELFYYYLLVLLLNNITLDSIEVKDVLKDALSDFIRK